MADQPQYLSQRILRAGVEKAVSEKLGTLIREFGVYTKGMTTADENAAKLMILDMMNAAAGAFITKMRVRFEKQESQPE